MRADLASWGGGCLWTAFLRKAPFILLGQTLREKFQPQPPIELQLLILDRKCRLFNQRIDTPRCLSPSGGPLPARGVAPTIRDELKLRSPRDGVASPASNPQWASHGVYKKWMPFPCAHEVEPVGPLDHVGSASLVAGLLNQAEGAVIPLDVVARARDVAPGERNDQLLEHLVVGEAPKDLRKQRFLGEVAILEHAVASAPGAAAGRSLEDRVLPVATDRVPE